MAGRSKETVYVSSPFVDLERHRAALKTALDSRNATWRNDLSFCRGLVACLSGLNLAD